MVGSAHPTRTFLEHLTIFFSIALLVGGGWYLRAWLHTGNPVYPFFRHVFGGAGLDEVWCGVFVGNEVSCRVAERLGLRFVGLGPDPWYDGESHLYRIDRDQWLTR